MKAKTNLIFIAGWGFKNSIWNNLTKEITNFNIVLLDLKQALDEHYILSLPANSILIGWSFGGIIAADICLRYQGKFKKLILVASSPKFIEGQNWPGITNNKAREFYLNYISNSAKQMTDFIKLVQYPNTNYAIRKMLKQNIDKQDSSPYLKKLLELDYREFYQYLTIPTLHIIGDHDSIVPVRIKQALASYNHQVIVIPLAGHALFITNQGEFIKHLMEFVNNA